MSYVTRKGPLFSERRGDIMRAFLFDAQRDVADEGVMLVRDIGQRSFRYLHGPPTFKWRDSVHRSQTFGGFIVRENVIYGPWLEGVSRRNMQTRFKGYSMFRRAAQLLGTEAHLIAQRALPPYLKMLGGR